MVNKVINFLGRLVSAGRMVNAKFKIISVVSEVKIETFFSRFARHQLVIEGTISLA